MRVAACEGRRWRGTVVAAAGRGRNRLEVVGCLVAWGLCHCGEDEKVDRATHCPVDCASAGTIA